MKKNLLLFRVTAAFLCAALCLTGCTLPGGEETQPTQSSTAGTTAPVETTTAPTEPATEPTAVPTEPATQPTTVPTEPATEPTTAPTELPTEPATQPDPETCSHEFSDWEVTDSATCTADGQRQRTCTVCAAVETEVIAAAGHSYGSWVTTSSATCTSDGKKERTCESCGKKETKTVSATGHSYGEGVITKEASSCADTGTVTYTCTKCAASYEQSYKGSHDFESTGNTWKYWKCTKCGFKYEDYFTNIEPEYSDADPTSALATDTVTLKEMIYTGKLSTWSEEWLEFRTVIYWCMMHRSECCRYGYNYIYPYEHADKHGRTQEEMEAMRDRFILFLDDFEDAFGWRPDDPNVIYSSYYQGYALEFDVKEMYSDYRSQIGKLSSARKAEIVEDITGYLVHSWGIYEGMSVYNACCLISENIWEWAYYDWSLSRHDAIDGFALGSCVCDGYAKMFNSFADYCGIDCVMVTGKISGSSHAWNKVTFSDGTVRYIDPTNQTELRPAEAMTDYKW